MTMPRCCLVLLLAFSAAPAAAADAGRAEAPVTRGELLYSTHCIACHTQQAHWRDRKVASDWPTLVAEIRRWQEVQKLGWNAADIDEVARHLNARYYRHTTPN